MIRTLISIAGALVLATAGASWAAHEGHGGGEGGAGGGGGKGKMGGMHGMHHPMPGAVEEMCHGGHGGHGMPPHYCAPHYKVMSSVPGVSISGVEPMGEKQLMVTLKSMPGVKTGALAIVGGGDDLAGGVSVAAGWKDGAVVHLDLVGTGSLYRGGGYHLHAFPLTGK